MLDVARRELELSTKASAIHIQKEELNIFVDIVKTLGTQSTFLAGLGWGALSTDWTGTPQWSAAIETVVFLSGSIAVSLHVINAFICALTVIYAPALAIRGPDGSLSRALSGLYVQRKICMRLYSTGMVFVLLNGALMVYMHAHLPVSWIPAAVVFFLTVLLAMYLAKALSFRFKLPVEYRRVGTGPSRQPHSHVGRPPSPRAGVVTADVESGGRTSHASGGTTSPKHERSGALHVPLCAANIAPQASIAVHVPISTASSPMAPQASFLRCGGSSHTSSPPSAPAAPLHGGWQQR